MESTTSLEMKVMTLTPVEKVMTLTDVEVELCRQLLMKTGSESGASVKVESSSKITFKYST